MTWDATGFRVQGPNDWLIGMQVTLGPQTGQFKTVIYDPTGNSSSTCFDKVFLILDFKHKLDGNFVHVLDDNGVTCWLHAVGNCFKIVSRSERPWFLYVLRCSGKSLYVGISLDPVRRMEQHRDGTGSKYVRSHLPFKPEIVIPISLDRGSATSLENRVKRLKKTQKERLLNELRRGSNVFDALEWIRRT